MANPSNLYEALGLPGAAHREAAQARMDEAFRDVLGPLRKADAWWEQLGNRTGLPTYHDIFAQTEELEAWVRERYPDAMSEDEGDGEEQDDGEAWRRWMLRLLAVGAFVAYVYEKLDYDVEIPPAEVSEDIPGFEIDGYPWTVEKVHNPPSPMAARVGDPMLHGGTAVPGPGSIDVIIGGTGALTVAHSVGACPMPHVTGLPHVPVQGPKGWTTWNAGPGTVLVNGMPLLRAGDWVFEHLGGNNPILAGAPTVLAGPQARPCVVQEVEYRGLPGGIERMGSLGGKYTFKASVTWNLQDMAGGVLAAGLVALGEAFPVLAPVTFGAARMLLAAIDGPTLEMEISVEETAFIEKRTEVDWDQDGEIDQIVLSRARVKTKAVSKHSVVLDPLKPGRAKDSKIEPMHLEDPEIDVDWQFLEPGEAREPWKE